VTSVAVRDRPLEPAGRRGSVPVERAIVAVQLVACYGFLVAVYWWQARSHGSPWLFSDEIEYTQVSRSIADSGEATLRGGPYLLRSVYPYVLAPVWWLSDTQTAYSVAKAVGVLLMSAVLFPTYWLARTLVPHWPALFAGLGAASVPAIGYSRLIVTETIAYPYAALCFLLIARALAAPLSRWTPAALLSVLAAPEIRSQFEVLLPVFAVAALVVLWLSAPAYRLRARWGALEWAGAIALAVAFLGLAHEIATRKSFNYYLATTLPDRWHDFSLWPLGALAIGTGLFPALAAALVLWRPEDARTSPAYRAFAGMLVGAVAAFVLYAGIKAVYLSTVFANVIVERNLIYLAPLLFVAAAMVLTRPTVAPVALLLGAGGLVYLVRETPYQLDHYPYSDAPGLAVLAELNRALALDGAEIESRLIALVAVFAALAVVLVALRRAPVAAAALASLGAAFVIGWNVVGEISFGDGINDLGNRLRSGVPNPPTWVDRSVERDASVFYLGQGIADPNPVLTTEFWNRRIEYVGSLDGTAPGPGPTVPPLPYREDGATLNDPGADYVVTDSPGIDVFGTEVQRTGLWRLIKLNGRLRLRSAVIGVYPDGWTGAEASYSRYGRGEKGTVEITVSRAGWMGPEVGGRVEIRIGRLAPQPEERIRNPCNGDVCLSQQPKIVGPVTVRRWNARSGQVKRFVVPVSTPFRVETRMDRTFTTRHYGGSDSRQLGVQVAFAFKPAS
jgi:hypothetical protein